jgi:hypothetical protein
MVSILHDFTGFLPATKGLIAAPWTPLASLCFQLRNGKRKPEHTWPVDHAGDYCRVVFKTTIHDVVAGFEKRP